MGAIMRGFFGDVVLSYHVGMSLPEPNQALIPKVHDETTLKVNSILDWEYAGFYPQAPELKALGTDKKFMPCMNFLSHIIFHP
jgi:hypothetical protein